MLQKLTFQLSSHQRKCMFTKTVFNTDTNMISNWAPIIIEQNHHITVISLGSCDTEDWSTLSEKKVQKLSLGLYLFKR